MITPIIIPPLYSPLNLVLFKVTSNRANLKQFRVTVLDGVTENVITIQKYAVTPILPNGITFDLAPVLSSFVDFQIINTSTILEQAPKLIQSYKCLITEIYGDNLDGDTLYTGVYNVFNATLSRVDFSSYNYLQYVGQVPGETKFLSKRPAVSSLYYSSKEYLYFITNADLKVRLTFYKKGSGVVGQNDIDLPQDNAAYRLNLSPVFLSTYFGESISNMYGDEFTVVFTEPFGSPPVALSDANYFTVSLITPGGARVSELRTYILKKENCKEKNVQVSFTNNLGGLDSVMFFHPMQRVTSEKTTIDLNPYQYTANGDYSDKANGKYNPDKKIIKAKNTSSFSMISEPLNDANGLYLRSLIESDNVFVKLSTGDFLPVSVEPIDYEIKKLRYNTNNNRFSLTFKVEDTDFNL